MIILHETANHKNVLFSNLTSGAMVQANQHVIIHENESMLLDPGGHKVYTRLFGELSSVMPINNMKHIFFSHQDPDIIAAANGWLMVTDAQAYLSNLWIRFIPHFGVDDLVAKKITAIPDRGMVVNVGGLELKLIPAHFLHSAGNFQVYDPFAKILYSGDLGASLGADYDIVENFESHIQYMGPFHQRYLPCAKALKMWVKTVRQLEIETIAPQHGAILQGPEMVEKFINWLGNLECGLDLMGDSFPIP
ncbi:MAG: MBL fold metallo-hydrolase [Thermodesulfobacteriota bacterium]